MKDKNWCFVTMKPKDECLHCYEEKVKYILDNWNCHNEETRKTINSIKFRLGLE